MIFCIISYSLKLIVSAIGKCSTFNAAVFIDTLFPPMFAPVMTVVPRSKRTETGINLFPLDSSASAIIGYVLIAALILYVF